MSKVLYIKANPKTEDDSYTFKMSEAFLEEYKKANPKDEITTLDLYQEDIKPLTAEMIEELFTKEDSDVRRYVKEFASADKYIIAAPMWNLSIPAILKVYIDYLVVAGITFKYTEEGPAGLLKDKKVTYLVARGGKYSEGPAQDFEMGERYLRTILGFMGITDFSTVATELTNVLQGKELEKSVAASIEEAKKVAKEF
ncbi:FMN-dependent NADH-azoreductase [Orenia metallireducens]|uniref:FMN dependent NADH:quinone oxidoreductase n=1 Tax=Orenia metallireducens TaxID=1413210 RepID=A0A1C0ACA9_9FIRM|nr:FMN-dependent NADH-azoreductase [Orenia metallireducens]OCL28010.1 FMN-dependent NADH-azoreductase [Orenia metallireducens]